METVFTRAAVLDLLTQIDELGDYPISITEEMDGTMQLQVGSSVYTISEAQATDVVVDDVVADTVEDINLQAYEELADAGQIDLQEPVESGILSQLAKTLMVGGLVRLGGKLIRNGVI